MRNSARKHLLNQSGKSHLKTLEKKYLASVLSGQQDAANAAFRAVSSALDKAVKSGVIPRPAANRKKSRLAVRMGSLGKGS